MKNYGIEWDYSENCLLCEMKGTERCPWCSQRVLKGERLKQQQEVERLVAEGDGPVWPIHNDGFRRG